MRVATIGIGSNSVRMLVADIEGQCRTIARDRAGTRLFAGLDENGNLGVQSMEDTLSAAVQMHDKAKAMGAHEVTIFATSAVRDAHNRQAFCDAVLSRTGIVVEVLSGETEAAFSFYGAAQSRDYVGVIDIGGGSTEIVTGKEGIPDYIQSLQLGAVRLFNMQSITTEQDVYKVIKLADDLLTQFPLPPAPLPEKWIGVGGTFTTLAAIVHKMTWTDTTSVHHLPLTLDNALDAALMLAPLTREERILVPGMRPQRADIVVHGICILVACMRSLNLSQIIVSENGNLNGFIFNRYGSMFTESLHK